MSDIEYREERPLSFSSPESKAAAVAVAEAFLEGTEPEDAEQPVAAVPMVVPSSPTPDTQAPTETLVEEPEVPAFDLTSFEPQLTDELAELLEDEPPDFEEQALAEIAAERQAAEDRDEYVEPTDTALEAKLRAAEKRNAFLESRLVETNRGKWVQENLRAYPLLQQFGADEVKAISASSRRAFAREASALNEKYMRMAKPLLEYQGKRVTEAREAAQQQERDRVTAAWGQPALDVAGAGASAEQARRIEKARKSEDLGQVIKAMIEPNPASVL